jgi:RHS repeat-associated protein
LLVAFYKNQLNGYSYDVSGNTTKDANSRKFTFDGENKQTKVETVDNNGTVTGLIGQYWYDGDGKRIRKYALENSQWTETVFVYDAFGKLVAEYSTQFATPQNATVSYLTNDNLGSPRINTDQNGQVTARHDYQPFGEEIQRASYGADDVRKQFTSYERDNETNLDFAQARYHNSNLGRFQSPDPVLISKMRIRNPQIWNSYSYAGNNPLRYIDPNGLEKIALGDDEKTIKKDIEAKKAEIKAIDKDKTRTKEQRKQDNAENNRQLNNLETKLDGTRLVNSILKDLDSIGERKGLQLTDFSLTTEPQKDFAGVSAARMSTIMGSQAFHQGGEIYIRTDCSQCFFNAITTQTDTNIRSDFLHVASAIVAHEQYHKQNPTDLREKPAYQREKDVLEHFYKENKFNNKITYDGDLKEINDAINNYP